MVVMLIISALVIDVGIVEVKKAHIAGVADAAVLAAVSEQAMGNENLEEVALMYCEKNDINVEKVDITIGNGVIVAINDSVDSIFSKIIGIEKINTSVKSRAIFGAVSEVYSGTRPIAVERQEFVFGQEVTLKSDSDSYSGNYGAVELGGSGANNYRYNIIYGYTGTLKVGDNIDTEPGNMEGPTEQGIDYITRNDDSTIDNYTKNSPRLWVIPVVDTLSVNGRKTVTIVGFAQFFVEDTGSKGEIIGRFIRNVANGKISENQIDYGLVAVKLVGGDF
ncbi:MAG: hypothetical protein A2Y22_02850 [Clostridiales bacterium GWD2_32_59]|nr:MAG: hypothetical protein A2Y22_02850 [Clostridiales bacterium GWD2_32_59]